MKPTGLPPFGNGQQFQMIFLFLSGLGIVFNAINPPPPPPVPLAANTLQNLWKDRMLGTTDTADATRQFRLTGPSVAPRNRFPIGFRWRKIPSNLFESFLFFFLKYFVLLVSFALIHHLSASAPSPDAPWPSLRLHDAGSIESPNRYVKFAGVMETHRFIHRAPEPRFVWIGSGQWRQAMAAPIKSPRQQPPPTASNKQPKVKRLRFDGFLISSSF